MNLPVRMSRLSPRRDLCQRTLTLLLLGSSLVRQRNCLGRIVIRGVAVQIWWPINLRFQGSPPEDFPVTEVLIDKTLIGIVRCSLGGVEGTQ